MHGALIIARGVKWVASPLPYLATAHRRPTMTRIKGRLKVSLVVVPGDTVLAMATVAAPLVASAVAGIDQFGFIAIRSGIPAGASHFEVTSPDLQNEQAFSQSEIANIFGCNGGNQAPRLQWSGAPAGTKSYAVTMFDPDAPTGSGFWHWLTWDIPASDTSLDATALPAGAVAGTNDAGLTGYLCPCPPPGDRTHRYQLTLYALDVPSLTLPPSVRADVVGFTMVTHLLSFPRLIGTFSQPAA